MCSLEYSAAGEPFSLEDCLTEECSQVLNKKLGRNFDMRRKMLSFKTDSVLNAVKKVFNVLLVLFASICFSSQSNFNSNI